MMTRKERKCVLHVFYCLTCGEEVYRVGPVKRWTRHVRGRLSDEEKARLVYTQHRQDRQDRHGKLTAGVYTFPLHEFRDGPEFGPSPDDPHDWRTVLPALGVPVGIPAIPDGEQMVNAADNFLKSVRTDDTEGEAR